LDPKLADETFKFPFAPESLEELGIVFKNGFSTNTLLKMNVFSWKCRINA
jgi:hypothetical protein